MNDANSQTQTTDALVEIMNLQATKSPGLVAKQRRLLEALGAQRAEQGGGPVPEQPRESDVPVDRHSAG